MEHVQIGAFSIVGWHSLVVDREYKHFCRNISQMRRAFAAIWRDYTNPVFSLANATIISGNKITDKIDR